MPNSTLRHADHLVEDPERAFTMSQAPYGRTVFGHGRIMPLMNDVLNKT